MVMMMERVPKPPTDSREDDLAERLSNYRSRAAREGRKVAVEKIDRAIEEARRPKQAKR
jgi:hypothetical protein